MQTIVSMVSLFFILYVYFTNHRMHEHWSHLRVADEMLPIRVALRRNMDVVSALIVSSDGTFLYPYDNRMCYFDTLIEQF